MSIKRLAVEVSVQERLPGSSHGGTLVQVGTGALPAL